MGEKREGYVCNVYVRERERGRWMVVVVTEYDEGGGGVKMSVLILFDHHFPCSLFILSVSIQSELIKTFSLPHSASLSHYSYHSHPCSLGMR